MDTIDKSHLELYQQEHRVFLHQRLLAILLVGFILIPLFSILDYVVVNEHFRLFLIYRMSCALSFAVLLLLYFSNFGKKYPFALAVAAYIIASVVISLMCVAMGGYDSFYYVGLLMVLITFSTLLPLNAIQASMSGILVYLVYSVPIILFSPYSEETLKIFFNNNFFFIFFIVLSILQCFEENKARVREFNLRMELDSLAERLSYYAHNLESEVDKRARELEESELRYRELYENIVDIVLLVDKRGNILMANPKYYDTVGVSANDQININFMTFIHPSDSLRVKENLLVKLLDGQDIQDQQFRILNTHGKVFSVECNARSIKKDADLVGFQMVIRDISERKKLEKDLISSYKDLQSARTATIMGLAKLAEYRDEDTGTHLERIREYAKVITVGLKDNDRYREYITEEYIEDIYNSSILHDIGKVGVPDSILLKPGKLTKEEFEIMKRHSALGGDALKSVDTQLDGQSFLTLGKEIAYYHHEKWNGKGYPEGLKGEEIPLSARIVALADVYDALTTKRVYKDAYSHEKAVEIITTDSGTHFDPDIVDVFLDHLEDFREIRRVFKEEDDLDTPEMASNTSEV